MSWKKSVEHNILAPNFAKTFFNTYFTKIKMQPHENQYFTGDFFVLFSLYFAATCAGGGGVAPKIIIERKTIFWVGVSRVLVFCCLSKTLNLKKIFPVLKKP